MPNQSTLLASVERTAIRLAAELGYEWIDLELVKEPAGRFLRFYIDKTGGITLDEIESFHRKIQAYAEDIEYDYMEVSSPGVDRPLKKPRDFERALGKRVEVRLYKPQNGAKAFTGELVGLREEESALHGEKNGLTQHSKCEVVVIIDGDKELSFDMKSVALVKPVIDIDEELLSGDIDAPEGEEDE